MFATIFAALIVAAAPAVEEVVENLEIVVLEECEGLSAEDQEYLEEIVLEEGDMAEDMVAFEEE